MDTVLWDTIDERIRQSDIDGAITLLEGLIASEKSDRFTGLIGARFTNPPEQVLSFINNFIRNCEQDFQVEAVYLEMNGFDINCDLWFFSPFGYETYEPDPDELDWLSDWQSEDEEIMSLTGLESVQADFGWYHKGNADEVDDYARIQELATLLVMVKFLDLVRSALASGTLAKPVPVLATAHDFDTIGRFVPAAFP